MRITCVFEANTGVVSEAGRRDLTDVMVGFYFLSWRKFVRLQC